MTRAYIKVAVEASSQIVNLILHVELIKLPNAVLLDTPNCRVCDNSLGVGKQKKSTTFATHTGLYHYKSLLFGVCSAGKQYQYLIYLMC